MYISMLECHFPVKGELITNFTLPSIHTIGFHSLDAIIVGPRVNRPPLIEPGKSDAGISR